MVVQAVKDRTATVRLQEELSRTQAEVFRLADELRALKKRDAFGRCAVAVVHDVKNLLGVMFALIEISRGLNPTGAISKNLEEMDKAAHRCAALLRDLLASGRQHPPRNQVLDLNVVVNSMADILQHALGENIRFSFEPAVPLGFIEADPEHIEQVLMNLVVNARDAMPEGGQITIKTAVVQVNDSAEDSGATPRRRKHVMLSVADRGQGMTQATLRQIFRPFFTTKPPGQGTGLGLSIVSALVQKNRGHIRVFSKPGAGARFELYFPRLRDAALSTRSTVQL